MFRTLKDITVTRKRVLVRVDFNVPQNKDGSITDDARIKAAIPTLRYLQKQKALIILLTHLGRPEGVDDRFRLDPIAKRLSKLLNAGVHKCDDVMGADVEDTIKRLVPGDICLLENLRFYPGEESNAPNFARALAELGDVYVNDAFSVSHRAHASIVGLPERLPSAAGFQLQKEIETMDRSLHNPKRPFIAVMGGAKVSDKIEVIEHLLKKVDALLIGGAMMFTFFKSTEMEIGKSKVELDKLALAKSLLKAAKGKIILPLDCIVAKDPDSKGEAVHASHIPKDKMGLDIGPETISIYNEILNNAKTVLWNGPLGMFEKKEFAKGTLSIAKTISKAPVSIVGGGDTADAVKNLKFTHVSTGGGASLDFFAGKTLPGIAALEKNYRSFKRA
jgi:phosphoglycerate kinase